MRVKKWLRLKGDQYSLLHLPRKRAKAMASLAKAHRQAAKRSREPSVEEVPRAKHGGVKNPTEDKENEVRRG